jgi:PAS domain S-box-containing protein
MPDARILIVEDEHIVALDIKTHLAKYGYNVPAIFSSGEEALENIEDIAPDLILMDIKLQGKMDGLATSDIVKKKYNIPVILLTAYADEETIQKAKLTQPFAYIIKPFEERELRTAIVIALYRHEMEKKLQEREHLFSTMIQSIDDGVIITDVGNAVEFLNRAAEGMCGKDLADVEGSSIDDLFTFIPVDSQTVKGTAALDNLFQISRSDGGHIFVEKRVLSLLDDNNSMTGYVWILHDITDSVKAANALHESEAQLRQAQKMEAVGRLSGGIAHDFNNLLTVIQGYSKLILESEETTDEIRQDVEGISTAVKRSSSLTKKLLTFSRHQIMELKTLKINKLLMEIKKMLSRLIGERVVIQYSLNAEPSMVRVDQGQIEQVLVNLVLNASDAVENGGSISIQTERKTVSETITTPMGDVEHGTYIVLTVRDNGGGIPEDIVENIFEPFFTTKEAGKGTGLGLSTVYGIIQQSEGYINVESRRDEGTVFTIYLPAINKAEETEETKDDIPGELQGSETILLVEDDENLRDLLDKVLQNNGYKTIVAQNAGEALLICENSSTAIDVLISDVIMPHLNGDKLASRLRKIMPELKILLISGYPDTLKDSVLFSEQNMFFLQKPFEVDSLLATIRNLCDSTTTI